MYSKLIILTLVGWATAQRSTSEDYIYDDLTAAPNLRQPVQRAPVQRSRPAPSSRLVELDVNATTTPVPILKDIRRVDPVTGAFIYEFMGADGSGKYETRFPNGTVFGNFTFINDLGEKETRVYSAGERGTEIAGTNVVSPAPPTLVDETTGENYVDLSNYELWKHLEEPYVHIGGPSDPDERGQVSNFNNEMRMNAEAARAQAPSGGQIPFDFDSEFTFAASPPARRRGRV